MGEVHPQTDVPLGAGSSAGLSDGQLLVRFLAQNGPMATGAFEALVHRHGPMVLATCRGVLRDEHDAEDAFQATFFVLARRARSLRREDRLGPWLHRIALRAAQRVRVAEARRRECETRGGDPSARGGPGLEMDAERCELRQVVHQEIERLSARDRAVVMLCDLQGESYEAAAAQLRVPVGTIRSRLSRARERLRSAIVRRGFALPVGVAAVLAANEVSAAVPPALMASTAHLAALAPAGGLAAGSASAAALAYGEAVLKTIRLVNLAKTAAVITVVGAALAGAGAGVFVLRGHPPANPAVPAGHPLTDLEQLQGRWIVIDAEQHGEPLALVFGDSLVIEGDQFAWTAARGEPDRLYRRGTTTGRLTLDPGAKPHRIDLIEPDRTIPAIYAFLGGGDRLRLCLGDPDGPGRPPLFGSDPASRQLLLVFRREEPAGRRGAPTARENVTKEKGNPRETP